MEGIEGVEAADRNEVSDSGRMGPDLEPDGGDIGREDNGGICGVIRELLTPLGELRPMGRFVDCVGVAAPLLSPEECEPMCVSALLVG